MKALTATEVELSLVDPMRMRNTGNRDRRVRKRSEPRDRCDALLNLTMVPVDSEVHDLPLETSARLDRADVVSDGTPALGDLVGALL